MCIRGYGTSSPSFTEILQREGLKASEAVFVGEDVIDLPFIGNCGLAIAVANARDQLKQKAQWVTPMAMETAPCGMRQRSFKAPWKIKAMIEKYLGVRSGKSNS